MAKYTKVKKVEKKESKAADAEAPIEIDVKLNKFFEFLVKQKFKIIAVISVVLLALIVYSIVKNKILEKKILMSGGFTEIINAIEKPVVTDTDGAKDVKSQINDEVFHSEKEKIAAIEKAIKDFEKKSGTEHLKFAIDYAKFVLEVEKSNFKSAYSLVKSLEKDEVSKDVKLFLLVNIAQVAKKLNDYKECVKSYEEMTKMESVLAKGLAYKSFGDLYNPMIGKKDKFKDEKKCKDYYKKAVKLIDNYKGIKTTSLQFIKNEVSKRLTLLDLR